MASLGYSYQHKLESQLGVIPTLLGEVTCFQVLQDHPCSEQYGRKACAPLESNILKALCPAPDLCKVHEEGGQDKSRGHATVY